jgi:hypothetical protein
MKILAFRLIVVAVIVALAEGLFLAAYLAHTHRRLSFAELQRERAQVIADLQDKRRPDGVQEEVVHPYLGFVYTPAGDGEGFRDFYGMGVSRWGFLDDKDPIQARAPNRVVIGIFGGSVAWYFSLDGADALVRALRQSSRFSDKEIVIVRAALFGYKQPQQFMALSYLLAMGGSFDIVLNLDGFNEAVLPAVENVPKGVFPFFPRNWFNRIEATPDRRTLAIMTRVDTLRQRRRRLARAASWPVVRHDVVANVGWKIYDEYLANTINGAQRDWLKQQASGATYVASGPFTPYVNDQALYRDLADKWKRSSEQMNRLARANGIAYFHFLQPNLYVPGTKPLSDEERRLAVDDALAPVTRDAYPHFIAAGAALQREGEWFTDLTKTFSDVKDTLYRDQCCHLNRDGNTRLAIAIARAVVQAR